MLSSVAGLVAARRAGKPCVIVPHESLTEYDVNRKGSAARIVAKRNLKRAYGKHCQLFVFSSQAEAAQSFPHGSRASQSVLPLPLYDDRAASRPMPRDFPGPGLRLGFLGRLHPKKNVDTLLRALALLPERFTLIIGGDGPPDLRSTLVSLADQLGISRRVSWKGFVPSDRKDEFFQSIDVLVMPSAFESFGIVAAEAMMRGVPAIVSRPTGAAEIISRHGGGLAVDSNETGLTEALLSLDNDRQRMSELSKAAIAVSVGELSFSHIGSRLRDHLVRIAGAS
jgi:glycosyltransferase involved in cell wall biosynthesis